MTVDGGAHWVKMSYPAQVRDIAFQKREGDLIARSAVASSSSTTTRRCARSPQTLPSARVSTRCATKYNELNQVGDGGHVVAEPAVWRAADLQRGSGAGRGTRSRADDRRRSGKHCAASSHRHRGDARPASRRVGPSRDSGGAPGGGRGGAGGGGGGFGGRAATSARSTPARYTATLGTLSGEAFTAIGKGTSFLVCLCR